MDQHGEQRTNHTKMMDRSVKISVNQGKVPQQLEELMGQYGEQGTHHKDRILEHPPPVLQAKLSTMH